MPTETSVPSRMSRYYQITVEGKVDASWSDWLGSMQLVSWQASDGRHMTTLSGVLADQAALRGLLIRLWDLNLVLRSLQQGDPAQRSKFK
jgi:hypothetical protein